MNVKQLIKFLIVFGFCMPVSSLIAAGIWPKEINRNWYNRVASEPDDIEVVNDVEEPSIFDGIPPEYTTRKRRRQNHGYVGQAIGEAITSAFRDILVLNKNLFTWNTFKIISATFPIFVAARMIDEKLQRCFYDGSCHKNVNQMPSWCHEVAKASIGLPIVLLGVDAFFSRNDDRRWTAQILLLGMPFVIWTKTLIKQIKFDACLRPWNEKFSCEQRAFGGFPSGHMAQALYMAVLYGTRYGPHFAIQLGLLAGFIGVTFVSCNRHYISQVIAGAAFGSIYALAASKLVDDKLANRVKFGIGMDGNGRPNFSVGVSW
ncbi:MAG: phosphatase PAP2 family protein [Acidobacteriia bacterium]|nr:phosphatase PAP2 family protein [Terriglobia bacterium]